MESPHNSGHSKILQLFYDNKKAGIHLRDIARKTKLNENSATRFLKQLEDHPNPEVGHYLERATVALFSPIEDKYLYDAVKYEAPYKHRGGSRRKQTRKIKRKQKPHH